MVNFWPVQHAFYHLYPLGALQNSAQPARELHDWLDYWQNMGVKNILLGPVFQSTSHGYDTADYFQIDARLGDNPTFKAWSEELHRRGLRLVLDGVFHHVGRDFWAFRDVQKNGPQSAYRDWFHLDFSKLSPYSDPFWYEGWAGHYDLVKLNLTNPAVRQHLLDAVRFWIEEFQIDGLRLDAADVLDRTFQRELAAYCRSLKPDFWLMGEVVHGHYRDWANPEALDATTNYEVFKGLYSSHNDLNYFEIAYSLNRLFGQDGLYCGLHLFNFVDNHDQARIASQLHDPAHLYPLHLLLFTIPGVPAVYYGSEIALPGVKATDSDWPLRPALTPATLQVAKHPLQAVIQRLIQLRENSPALQTGQYQQLHVNHQQFAFQRELNGEEIVVAVNSAHHHSDILLNGVSDGLWQDLLNQGETFNAAAGHLSLPLAPCWGRILRRQE